MKIRSVEELGEAIRTRRKELHYTQAFLAEFISDVERGKATAEIGKTLQLLMILGLDLSVERRA